MMVVVLLAFSGQSPDQGFYTPFSPQETLNVELIASWGDGDTSNNGCSVAVRNRYAYLAVGWSGLVVLDVRNPQDTVIEVHRIDSVPFRGVAIKDSFLLGYCGNGRFDCYSIADPDSPVFLSRALIHKGEDNKDFAEPVYIYISSDYAYVTFSGYAGPYIVDISNPDSIFHVGTGYFSARQVAFYPPCYLYASSNAGDEYTDILYILDVSDPANPYAIDSLVTDWGVSKALEVYDHYLYCGEKWVTVWDISDPLNPTFVYGALPLVQSAADYFINPQNKRLYLVDYLYVMDLSDPAYPIKVGEWHDTEYWCFSVFYDRGYIYTAGRGAVDHSVDLYILHYKYDTIPEDTGSPYLEWVQTIYGNPGLRFSLKQESNVSFSLFNAAGQRVFYQDLGFLGPGPYTRTLPPLRAGVYFLLMKANEENLYKRIVFTR